MHGFRNHHNLDLHLSAGFEIHLGAREQELRMVIPALVSLRREEARAEYQDRYNASSRPSKIAAGDLDYRFVERPVPGGYRRECNYVFHGYSVAAICVVFY